MAHHLPRHARLATAQTRRGTRQSSPTAHPEREALLALDGRSSPAYVRLVARTKPRYSAITLDLVRKSLSENSPAPAPRSMLWLHFWHRSPRCSTAQGPLGHVPVDLTFECRRPFFLLVRQRRPLRVARRRTEVRSHRRIQHAHSAQQDTDQPDLVSTRRRGASMGAQRCDSRGIAIPRACTAGPRGHLSTLALGPVAKRGSEVRTSVGEACICGMLF